MFRSLGFRSNNCSLCFVSLFCFSNNRRMVFDLGSDIEPSYDDANSFIEDLLSTALSFSFDELKQHPEAFVQFLDSTSLLRTIRLEEFDRESPQVYCIFVNLYHCLLQHALLCSVNGPLHKRAYARFMLTSCYEIGGDVFSLAELYSCVIRGNMPRPITAKPPYIEAPKVRAGRILVSKQWIWVATFCSYCLLKFLI